MKITIILEDDSSGEEFLVKIVENHNIITEKIVNNLYRKAEIAMEKIFLRKELDFGDK